MRPGVSANGEAGQSLWMICPRNRQYRAGRRGDDTLWQAVQTLPRDQREAVVLFYYEDLPTEEIARIVGTSPGAVRVRLSRAREKLRSILKEGDYG